MGLYAGYASAYPFLQHLALCYMGSGSGGVVIIVHVYIEGGEHINISGILCVSGSHKLELR